MEIEVQKPARRCHSIHEYTANDIKVLLKWDFLQSQLALTNIFPLSPYFSYHITLKASGTFSRNDILVLFSVLSGEPHLYFQFRRLWKYIYGHLDHRLHLHQSVWQPVNGTTDGQ